MTSDSRTEIDNGQTSEDPKTGEICGGVYKKDGEGDVQPKHECKWMELESLSCLESFGATKPCKQEGLVRGLGW